MVKFMSDVLDWLLIGLKKPGKSKKGLALALGKSNSVVTDIVQGVRPIRVDEIRLIANYIEEPAPAMDGNSFIPVVGLIALKGEISLPGNKKAGEPLFRIALPFPMQPDAVGFQVEGDALYPAYEHGDVIIVSDKGEEITSLIGQDAVVTLYDGTRMLRRVRAGSKPGLFDLESHREPVLRDQRVVWGSGVIARVPRAKIV